MQYANAHRVGSRQSFDSWLPMFSSMLRVLSIVVVVLLCACGAEARGRKKQPPATPIDLNTATIKDLEQLPGIGPTTAKAIIQFRTKSGPFQRIDDLLAIRRISESKFDKLRPYITVRPPKHPH